MSERDVQWLARAFGALSNENRLRMFQQLRLKAIECNANDGCCDFSDRCCNLGELSADLAISQATASHHLKELSHNDLVETRREGRYLRCSVNDATIERLEAFLSLGSLTPRELPLEAGTSSRGCTTSSDDIPECGD